MNNYLQTFLAERKQLLGSISNQSTFINQLINFIDNNEEVVDTVTANITNITSNIKLSDSGLEGQYKDSEGNIRDFSVSIEDIAPEHFIEGLNMTIASIIQNVSESQDLNCVMAQINDALLNYGEIDINAALAIVDSYGPGSGTALQTFKSILSLSGVQVIDAQAWQSILYNFNNETAKACENGDLVLDNNTKVVSAYVGTAVLGVISTVVQMIGTILTATLHIIGIIIIGIGAALGWIANAVVDTTFEMNYKALNYNLRTPVSALTVANMNTDDSLVNSGVFQFNTVGATHYVWRTKLNDSDTVYANTYLDVSIDPRKYRDFLIAKGFTPAVTLNTTGNNIRLDWNFTSDNAVDLHNYEQGIVSFYTASAAYNVFNQDIHTDDEHLHYSAGDLIAHNGDRKFWYKQILTAYAIMLLRSMCIGNFRESGYELPAGTLKSLLSINYLAGSSVSYSESSVSAFAIQFLFASDSDQDTIMNQYSNVFELYCSHVSDILPHIISEQQFNLTHTKHINCFPQTQESLNNAYFRATPACLLGFDIDLSNLPNDYVALSANPTKFFINWPDYAPNALLSTLAIVAGVVLVGTAVGIGIRTAYNNWKIRSSIKATDKVRAAKSAFDANPTLENANKLRKASNWYNFKASLFGWSKYDALNDWYESPGSDSSVSGKAEQLVDSIHLDDIAKLIKR